MKGKRYYAPVIRRLDTSHPWAEWVNNNKWMLDYLIHHYSSAVSAPEYDRARDSTRLQVLFQRRLRRDTLFNRVISHWTAKRLDPDRFAPDTVDTDRLLSTASKFFYLSLITPGGRLGGHICVGRNGLDDNDFPDMAEPFIRAFAYEAILRHLRDP